jgi:protein gp37
MGVRPNPLEHGRYWDATVNVVGGCEIVDRSCRFCYAARDAAGIQTATDIELYKNTTVFKRGRWTWNRRLTVLPPEHPAWTFALSWRGAAEPLLGKGKPSLLWVNSMSDIFHPGHPPEAIDRILEVVAISSHIGLVVSKHVTPMVEYFNRQPDWWRRRFWLVFSAGDQRWFERRWQLIRPLAESGWTIGTSIQPMLGPVVLPPDFLALARWVIVGGEQHPGHRVMDPDWARALRDQCKAAGLPFFVKQMTQGWLPPDLQIREFPKV